MGGRRDKGLTVSLCRKTADEPRLAAPHTVRALYSRRWCGMGRRGATGGSRAEHVHGQDSTVTRRVRASCAKASGKGPGQAPQMWPGERHTAGDGPGAARCSLALRRWFMNARHPAGEGECTTTTPPGMVSRTT